jgi:hydroxyacylglutathione hydrolase
MKLAVIPVTAFQQNCTLMWCEETLRAAVSDPGGDLDRIEQAIQHFGVTLDKVFLTHGHADHCAAAALWQSAMAYRWKVRMRMTCS